MKKPLQGRGISPCKPLGKGRLPVSQVAVDYALLEEKLPGWWHKWDPHGHGVSSSTTTLSFLFRSFPLPVSVLFRCLNLFLPPNRSLARLLGLWARALIC